MKLMTAEEQKETSYQILLYLDKICRDNSIHYSLTGGTLLGAVRHKGFIPWDDDIDVFLSRPEYEKLNEVLLKQEEYKWMTSRTTEGFCHSYSRLVDKRTAVYDKELEDMQGLGIFIDICVVDGLPEKKWIRKLHILKMRTLYRIQRSTNEQKEEYIPKNPVKRILKTLLRTYAIKKGQKYWADQIEKNAKKYPFEKGTYVANLMSQYGGREVIHRKGFDVYREMKFEDHSFEVFSGWKEYLKNVYGDYMTLPPVEKRIGHHFDEAYWL